MPPLRLPPEVGRIVVPVGGAIPRVPPLDALRDLLERRVVVARSGRAVAEAIGREHAFAAAHAATETVAEKVRAAIAKALRTGQRHDEAVASVLRAGGDWTRAYAETVFRTNATAAYTAGTFATASDPAVRAVIPGVEYQTSRDVNVRPNHAKLQGVAGATDDPAWLKIGPPNGYNCFLPGTLAEGAIEVASKSRYAGPAVEIQTRYGRRLRVTVNHPILTRAGWKGAGDLAEGDHLVCYGPKVETFDAMNALFASPLSAGWAVDGQKVPARVEDLFDTLAVHGACPITSSVLPLDLHGDARFVDGEVNVARADGFLPHRLEAPRAEYGNEFEFVHPDTSSNLSDHPERSTDHLVLPDIALACGLPRAGALALEDPLVVRTRTVLLPLEALRIGSAAYSDVCTDEARGEGASSDSCLAGELQNAHPADVSFDQVAKVRHFDFRGHVYDLQTRTGWIVASGIVTSNCRCNLILRDVLWFHERGLILKDGGIRKIRIPSGGGPDEGFRRGGRPDLVAAMARGI